LLQIGDALSVRRNYPLARPLPSIEIKSWRIPMATIIEKDSGGGGGNVFLGFILGAVLIVAGIIGFFMWDNYKSGGAPKAVIVNGQNK
jgi:hypothetical protein